ncbi:hypothetical protein B0H14DRAFT_3147548 [Mycena olivaceomarginata]|nr:hypothetical protein B0H14DRAFT_3147548 [Mycena olivaceomarginata]
MQIWQYLGKQIQRPSLVSAHLRKYTCRSEGNVEKKCTPVPQFLRPCGGLGSIFSGVKGLKLWPGIYVRVKLNAGAVSVLSGQSGDGRSGFNLNINDQCPTSEILLGPFRSRQNTAHRAEESGMLIAIQSQYWNVPASKRAFLEASNFTANMSLHVPQINLAPILAVAEDANHHTPQDKKRTLERITNVEGRDKRMQDLQLVAERQKNGRTLSLELPPSNGSSLLFGERCTALDSQIEHYRAVAGNLGREKMAEREKLGSKAAQVASQRSSGLVVWSRAWIRAKSLFDVAVVPEVVNVIMNLRPMVVARLNQDGCAIKWEIRVLTIHVDVTGAKLGSAKYRGPESGDVAKPPWLSVQCCSVPFMLRDWLPRQERKLFIPEPEARKSTND